MMEPSPYKDRNLLDRKESFRDRISDFSAELTATRNELKNCLDRFDATESWDETAEWNKLVRSIRDSLLLRIADVLLLREQDTGLDDLDRKRLSKLTQGLETLKTQFRTVSNIQKGDDVLDNIDAFNELLK